MHTQSAEAFPSKIIPDPHIAAVPEQSKKHSETQRLQYSYHVLSFSQEEHDKCPQEGKAKD